MVQTHQVNHVWLCRALLSAVLALSCGLALYAGERPTTVELLPQDTLAYVRIPDVPDLIRKHKETAFGRMLRDEQLRPILGELYGSVVDAAKPLEEQLGVSIDQLMQLLQGQACAALVPPETGRPALVLLVDVNERLPIARRLLEEFVFILERRGARVSTESWRDITVDIFDIRQDLTVAYFELDDTIVLTSDISIAQQIIDRWKGLTSEEEQTFADNRQFSSIVNRSRGAEDELPHVVWFADPIETMRTFARDNFAMQAGVALLPSLGLDGVEALGGTMTFAPDEFDSISHFHVLLDSPRSGVVDVVELTSGDTTVERWVPADVESYMTLHWNVPRSLKTLEKVVDSFRGEDAFSELLDKRLSQRIGVDFEDEFVSALTGRFTHLTWVEPPARVNSQVHLFAAKLKDVDQFGSTMEKMTQKLEGLEEVTFAGTTYFVGEPRPTRQRRRRNNNRVDEERAENQRNVERLEQRMARPCLAIVGEYLVFTESEKLLEHVIVTQSNAAFRLADDPDYAVTRDILRLQAGGENPGLISFSQPEETLRMYYELISSDDTQRVLESRSTDNRVLGALHGALQGNPLPPLSRLVQYLTPSGAIMVNDENGLHYTAFALKSD